MDDPKEIMDVKKALRLKTEEISESRVRMEMAEKRLATSGKEGDERVVRLQRRVEDLQQDMKKKEREYEQTMDTLQQDIDLLEKENSDLKDKLKSLTKRALLQGISKPDSMGIVSTPTSGISPAWPQVQDSPLLVQQIEQLRAALSATQQAKWRVEGERMRRAVATLRPLNVPKKPVGLVSLTGLTNLDQATHKRHDELNQLLRESQRLQKEFIEYAVQHKIVDLSKRGPGKELILEKQTPTYHLMQQIQKGKHLNDWLKDLNVRMQRYRASQLPGAKAHSDFASFPTTHFTKSQKEPILVGRIKIGSSKGSQRGDVPVTKVILTQEQLQGLHKKAFCS